MIPTIRSSPAVLSPDQEGARRAMLKFALSGAGSHFRVAGLAGTGKTFLGHLVGRELATEHGLTVAYGAPTGRAAAVLRSKGVECNTLCSLVYRYLGSVEDILGREVPVFADNEKSLPVDLLVMDEASMISTQDLEALGRKRVRTIFIGDHGQLPPVGGDPGLMRKPHIALETPHRQVAGSGVIRAAYHARQGGAFRPGRTDGFEYRVDDQPRGLRRTLEWFLETQRDVIICGWNRTRWRASQIMREIRGYSGPPCPGEPILVRKNHWGYYMMNGEVYTVDRIVDETATSWEVRFEGREDPVPVWKGLLLDDLARTADCPTESLLATWGHAITCHSAQGSEWDRVGVVEEPVGPPERWVYTAITRAARDVKMVRL